MLKYSLTLIIALLLTIQIYSQSVKLDFTKDRNLIPPITMINNVHFIDTSFNNPIAGCSFTIDVDGEIFAVTCKHALWVAKSDTMKHIHFEGTLDKWTMERKDDSSKYLVADKLINENREELIEEANANKDYLVFTIAENHTDVTPLKIRESELEEGEEVYLIGWSFKNKTGPQRIYAAKYYKTQGAKILIYDVEGEQNKAGMSGGPVVDKTGELVGIVSNWTQEEGTGKWYLSPCSTEYLKEILDKYSMN